MNGDEILTKDIVFQIIRSCESVYDLKTFMFVNKLWNIVASDERIWDIVIQKQFPQCYGNNHFILSVRGLEKRIQYVFQAILQQDYLQSPFLENSSERNYFQKSQTKCPMFVCIFSKPNINTAQSTSTQRKVLSTFR